MKKTIPIISEIIILGRKVLEIVTADLSAVFLLYNQSYGRIRSKKSNWIDV